MPGSVKGLSVGRSLIPGERGAGGGCLGLSFTNWYLLSGVFPVVSLFLISPSVVVPPLHTIYIKVTIGLLSGLCWSCGREFLGRKK